MPKKKKIENKLSTFTSVILGIFADEPFRPKNYKQVCKAMGIKDQAGKDVVYKLLINLKDEDKISTKDFETAIIEISESNLLTQEPQPIAEAPAANANEAVVGLIPVAVIIGISTFLESSIVLANVNSALFIKALAPEYSTSES